MTTIADLTVKLDMGPETSAGAPVAPPKLVFRLPTTEELAEMARSGKLGEINPLALHDMALAELARFVPREEMITTDTHEQHAARILGVDLGTVPGECVMWEKRAPPWPVEHLNYGFPIRRRRETVLQWTAEHLGGGISEGGLRHITEASNHCVKSATEALAQLAQAASEGAKAMEAVQPTMEDLSRPTIPLRAIAVAGIVDILFDGETAELRVSGYPLDDSVHWRLTQRQALYMARDLVQEGKMEAARQALLPLGFTVWLKGSGTPWMGTKAESMDDTQVPQQPVATALATGVATGAAAITDKLHEVANAANRALEQSLRGIDYADHYRQRPLPAEPPQQRDLPALVRQDASRHTYANPVARQRAMSGILAHHVEFVLDEHEYPAAERMDGVVTLEGYEVQALPPEMNKSLGIGPDAVACSVRFACFAGSIGLGLGIPWLDAYKELMTQSGLRIDGVRNTGMGICVAYFREDAEAASFRDSLVANTRHTTASRW